MAAGYDDQHSGTANEGNRNWLDQSNLGTSLASLRDLCVEAVEASRQTRSVVGFRSSSFVEAVEDLSAFLMALESNLAVAAILEVRPRGLSELQKKVLAGDRSNLIDQELVRLFARVERESCAILDLERPRSDAELQKLLPEERLKRILGDTRHAQFVSSLIQEDAPSVIRERDWDKIKREVKESHQQYLQSRLAPYTDRSQFCQAARVKKEGVGGHDTIRILLDNDPKGSDLVGYFVDRIFLRAPVAEAHRVRINDLTDIVLGGFGAHYQALTARYGGSIPADDARFDVGSIGSGPARELRDALPLLRNHPSIQALSIHLFDINAHAVERAKNELGQIVAQIRGRRLGGPTVDGAVVDIVPFIFEYAGDTLPEERGGGYNLLEVAGIVDYFPDKMAVPLVAGAFDRLRPGGILIVTTVGTKDPDRGVRYTNLGWELFQRDEIPHLRDLAKGVEARFDQFRTSRQSRGNTGREVPKLRVRFREDLQTLQDLVESMRHDSKRPLIGGDCVILPGHRALNYYLILKKGN